MKAICKIQGRSDFLLDLLVKIRQDDLAIQHGAPDELLLHSGGPQSDLAERSLLMGPAIRRYIVRQQPLQRTPVFGSPLRGEIDVQSNPIPIPNKIIPMNKKRLIHMKMGVA